MSAPTIAAAPTKGSETVSFPVEGMTCASCVNRITRYLRAVDGVNEADVNLATESATVTFEPSRLGLAELAAAVEAAGYVARIERASAGDEPAGIETMADERAERDMETARRTASLRRRLIVATILTIPLLGAWRA